MKGRMINDAKCTREIKSGIAMAKSVPANSAIRVTCSLRHALWTGRTLRRFHTQRPIHAVSAVLRHLLCQGYQHFEAGCLGLTLQTRRSTWLHVLRTTRMQHSDHTFRYSSLFSCVSVFRRNRGYIQVFISPSGFPNSTAQQPKQTRQKGAYQ